MTRHIPGTVREMFTAGPEPLKFAQTCTSSTAPGPLCRVEKVREEVGDEKETFVLFLQDLGFSL